MRPLIIVKDGRYGVKNAAGQVIVEPSYDKIRKFVNGFAAVCKDDQWGYLNEAGELIVAPIYHRVKNFSPFGVAIIQKTEAALSWRLINEEGQELAPTKDELLGPIADFNPHGIAIVRLYSCYRLLNIKGHFVNDDRYQEITYSEDEEVFKGQKLGNLCLINSLGDIVTYPEKNYDSLYFPTCGLSIVSLDELYGYIDKDGKEVIPLQYTEAYEFSESGLAFVVFEDGLGGYINTKGELVIEAVYDTGTVFKKGLAAVSQSENHFYIDEKGEQAFPQTFKKAEHFTTAGLANVVTPEGKQMVIQTDGTVVFDLDEDYEIEAFGYHSDLTKVKHKDQFALMNNTGDFLTDFVFDEIVLSDFTDTHPFLKEGLWGYINNQGEIVIDNMYEEASQFTDYNVAKIGMQDPFYSDYIHEFYINKKNDIIDDETILLFEKVFEHHFDGVQRFHNNLTIAVKKAEEVVLNGKGDVIYKK